MTVRFATPDEIKNWNDRVVSNPDGGNIFQGREFAEQKKLGGWTPRFIVADDISITALEKRFLFHKLWYLPKGPGITSVRELDELLPGLKTFARSNGVFAIKVEPELTKKDETLADLLKLGLVKTRPIQPNFSTVTLDISQDLSAVLASLNQKGRHAIRRAERDGVTVQRVEATDENCRAMYDLLALTAKGSFAIRSYNYYKTFWQRYEKAGLGQLFFAYFEGKAVAGAYALVLGKKSTYKDGASVRERTAYGASHLLQWEVIKWAKENGSQLHDFCGAPPSDQINNPDHPHYGIGRFKTSFNKEVTDYVGAYDVVVQPLTYKLWTKIGERLVRRIYTYRHHENYY
ncbi:MAG TPA: peptidoglycan bridge formation glycyltransferase FemA/FemB family protein [Candidatus Saccharimonadales bacterium]|nr:peptidoglycan bridge formation glycyltransferase FemA/FemB family protein [Candidatus Saccharimonadales bacterium]